MAEAKLPYGVRIENGVEKLIHISEIKYEETGRKCKCICPACGARLQAKLPKTDPNFKPRFAHDKVDTCSYAAETAIHLKAKEIIEKKKWMLLPKIYAGYRKYNPVISKEREIEFEDVKIENHFGGIIPDVVAYVKDNKTGEVKPLLIEIKVTHGIDDKKLEIIRKKKLATIEVDLSDLKGTFDSEVLLNEVIVSAGRKEWIYNHLSEAGRVEMGRDNSLMKQRRSNFEINAKKRKKEERKIKVQNIKREHNTVDHGDLYRKWENAYTNDPRWKDAISRMNISENYVPDYINQKIDGEYIFGCDRRIWQAVLYDKYIHVKNGSPNFYLTFNFDEVRTRMICEFEEEIYEDFIHLRNYKELKGIPDLTDVIYNYLLKLEGFGIIRRNNSKNKFGACYSVI